MVPKGVFINEIIEGIRIEFKEECNYEKEAEKLKRYRKILASNKSFYVPELYESYSNRKCLCMEYVSGTPIDDLCQNDISQEIRNHVGTILLELCLIELSKFRFMQTDPNPANFFYDSHNNRLNLIDLGAGRDFDKDFIDGYMEIIYGAAENDTKRIIEYSKKIGLLTGEESKKMIQAHVNTALAIGECFTVRGSPYYDFTTQDATNKGLQKIYDFNRFMHFCP